MIQMPPLGGIFLCNRGVMTLAATRLIALHKNKGKSVAACLKSRTDYAQNPDKTNKGELVSSYECSPLTADEEFMLTKRQYDLVNGRRQKSDVIAYQIRQSFRPGEISAEEANKVGYELAMRFTKGKHAFVVATHTDRQHIHNHVIFNSTALDGSRKFRDFFFSALAVQRLSDLICLEHQLSVIEKKPYRERQKRIVYPPKESNRDRLCGIIDTILAEKPGDYETFLQKLERQGYEVKRGKYTSVKGKGQKRFIRFRTLGTGYGEDEIKAVLEGKVKHQPYQKKPPKEQPFQLLVDIQGKMAEGKSVGYKKWATKFNLKEMSKTLLFLQEQKIGSAEELRERATAATERYHATISLERRPASFGSSWPEVASLAPWCLMASNCIFRALARSLGRIFSRWLVLSSTICVMACSSVRSRTIQGISTKPASSLAFWRRWPDTISYPPSSRGRTIAGWVTPLSRTLDTMAFISSSLRTWKG